MSLRRRWQSAIRTPQFALRNLVFAIVAVAGPASVVFAAGIPWETRLDRATAAARRTNQPLLLEFWAAWCPPCKVMDAEVYSDERVATAMAKVLPVRVDMDKRDDLARKYNVASMPTLVFTDSYGHELFRYTGLLNVDSMVQLLDELPGDLTRVNRLREALARDSDDFAALEGLGSELRALRLYRASNEYYARALRAPAVRQQPGLRADALVAMGRNHLELKELSDAVKVLERYLQEFAGRPAEPDVMLDLGRALLAQNRKGDARRVLQSLTARYTSGPAHAEATRLLAGL